MDQISFVAMLLFGLLTSFGHCVGMCGGVVVAYSAIKCKKGGVRVLGHLFYSLGRTTSYVLIVLVASLTASHLSISATTKAIFMMALAVVMVVLSLSLLGKIDLFNLATTGSIGKRSWFKNLFSRLIRSNSLVSFFGIGLLNGLLPCAPVYVAIAMALSAQDVPTSLLMMAVYGAATMPSLFVLGNIVGFMKEVSHRDLFNKLAAFMVILFAMIIFVRALRVVSA